MFKPERLMLCIPCLLLVATLAACGVPATQAPTLEPTLVYPTRIPVQAAATSGDANQPTVVAGQPTTAPTVAPTIAPTVVPPTVKVVPPTVVPPTATQRALATATKAGGAGDPARGETYFHQGVGVAAAPACETCHNVTTADIKVGPSLQGLTSRVTAHLKPGQDIATYLRTSILKPNDFLVPDQQGHPFSINGTSLMFQDYAKYLSDAQVSDLVAYLMTLK